MKGTTIATASNIVIPVEIVRYKDEKHVWIVKLIAGLYLLAVRTLIVWWAFAVWFPELGLTYWQLLLPVYAVRIVLSEVDLSSWRPLGKKRSEVRQLP